MDNYLKQTPEFDLSLDLNLNTLFVLSNVLYNWENAPFTSAWTPIEKNQMQAQINSLIWNNWNNLFNLTSNEKSLFSKKKTDNLIPVIFVAQMTNTTPHWTVEVSKIQKGGSLPNYIQWSLRKIHIAIEDSSNQQSGNRHGSNSDNSDSYWGMHTAEFSRANSINTFSVGNIGNQLRESYIELLLPNINGSKDSLVPKKVFTINN